MDPVAEIFLRRVLVNELWRRSRIPLGRCSSTTPRRSSPSFAGRSSRRPRRPPRIDVPTLSVASEESPPAFRRVTERVDAAISNSRTILVGRGHVPVVAGTPRVLTLILADTYSGWKFRCKRECRALYQQFGFVCCKAKCTGSNQRTLFSPGIQAGVAA
jgi:hypothetical protein